MPFVTLDGISTRYEVVGDGPPLLCFSPGGFNASLDTWSNMGCYAKTKPIEHLSKHYTCIIYDRRECGQSGGRVERVEWRHFVAQGTALLDHLHIDKAHLMGGCMGVSPVTAFGAMHPERVLSMVLYWPVGGAKYRLSGHQRFAEHLAYVSQNGLEKTVELAISGKKPFNSEPRGGPWASVLQHDADFARDYAAMNVEHYKLIVAGMARTLFDRDTAPGAEPEDMLRLDIPALILPGADASHATSSARYLQECLPKSVYWDVPTADQTYDNTGPRILEFLDSVKA